MGILEKYVPSILKWLLIIMFSIGIIYALLNASYVDALTTVLVMAYNIWGIYFAWKNGKLTRQSTFSHLIALAFFICSWQLVLIYAYTGKFGMVTLLLTIAFAFLFLLTQGLEFRRRKIAKKEAEEKELARIQRRAERKAAKKNKTNN